MKPKPLNTISEGTVVRIPLAISPEQMTRYGELSGDLNPLHCDDAYARRHGFQERVVYGGLLIAAVSRLLGMELPGPGWIWHNLKLQFKMPLYTNQKAEVVATVNHVNSALGAISLKIEILCQGKLIAQGDVQSGMIRPA